jgi:hypothetical protein
MGCVKSDGLLGAVVVVVVVVPFSCCCCVCPKGFALVLVLGCANENEAASVALAVVFPKVLARGAPKADDGWLAGFVLVPKLNPVLVLAPVVDVFVFCPKVNPFAGFDWPSENALAVEADLSDPNENGVVLLPVPPPKPENGEDCGSCMAGVSFFSTLRVGLSSIRSAATSIPSPLSAVDSGGLGVLGGADVPTLPNPPKIGLGASGVGALAASLVVAPEPEENALIPDVTPNVKPAFFSAGGGVEGAAPKENGDFVTSLSDAFG